MRSEPLGMRIDLSSLADLSLGCTVLAGGGGGDPRIGRLMAEQAISELGAVEVLAFDALADDDLIMPCGMIGAPTVMIEKFPNGGEGRVIRDTYERHFGRPVKAVMPLRWAGSTGSSRWPGRPTRACRCSTGTSWAVPSPELQMLTPHLLGMSGSPAVITDERLQTIIYSARDNVWLEKLVRNSVATLGGAACGGIYPMSAGRPGAQ